MIWTLELSWVAEHRDLFTVGYPASERIMMALYQLAETGRPVPQQVSADEPNHFRLRVTGAEARLFIDRRTRTIRVERIFRRR